MNDINVPSRLKKRLPFTVGLVEVVVAIWVSSSFYILQVTSGQNIALLFLPLLAGAVVLILLTYRKPRIATVHPLLSLGVFLLNISILASYLCNTERYDLIFILGNILSSLMLFVSLYVITTKIELDFRKTLILQSVFGGLLLPVVLATSPVSWGRLNPVVTPNYVGMMALLCFLGALGVRSAIGALTLAALPLYSMLVLQSRDALLAAMIAVCVTAVFYIYRHRSKKLVRYLLLAFFGGLVVCVVLALSGIPIFEFMGSIVDSVFMLSDEQRGLNSGGTGRSGLWSAAINLWLTHPLFGVGFKGHPMMMPEQLPAHNAYLGMLADTGTVGFASYLLIISFAIGYISKRGNLGLSEYPQRATIILTYLIYGIFESRAFSFGNSYSIIFMLVVFDSSKRRLENDVESELPHAMPSLVPREGPYGWRQQKVGPEPPNDL